MAAMAVTDLTKLKNPPCHGARSSPAASRPPPFRCFFSPWAWVLACRPISPWSDQGVSATTFEVGTGIYLVSSPCSSSAVGGYLAGRLRATWAGVHNDEIYFRDTAHGLLAWAFATILGATALGAATTHIVAGAAAGLAPAAATSGHVAGTADRHLRRYVAAHRAAARQRRRAPATRSGRGLPTAGDNSSGLARRSRPADYTPVLRKGGEVSPADRTYLAKSWPRAPASASPKPNKRVYDVIVQAKQAADDARKAMAKLMLWLAASMLAGAVGLDPRRHRRRRAARLEVVRTGLARQHGQEPLTLGPEVFSEGVKRCQFFCGCWECRSPSSSC